MKLTDIQQDALKEFINIGVGRAAGSLNSMLDAKISLQVPQVKLLTIAELRDEIKVLNGKRLSTVRLHFRGSFSGIASLIFPPDSATKLVKILTSDMTDDMELDAIRIGTLTEVGNIVINGVMGSISNILQEHLTYSVPVYSEDELEMLVKANTPGENSHILYARTSFYIQQLHIQGSIILLFEVGAFDRLMAAIDRLIDGMGKWITTEEIQLAAEKFSVLDQVPPGMCLLREDYIILFWNTVLEDWTQASRQTILGTDIRARFPHLGQPRYTSRLAGIFEGGPPVVFSSQLHKYVFPSLLANGELRTQHTIITAVKAFQGQKYYALFAVQDMTEAVQRIRAFREMRDQALKEVEERKKVEKQRTALLEEQERREVLQRFITMASHDLRTPLTTMTVSMYLLQKTGELNETQQKHMMVLETQVNRLEKLLRDMLNMSHLEQVTEFSLKELNLNSLIKSVIGNLEHLVMEKKHHFVFMADSRISPVMADRLHLGNALSHIIHNALLFTPPGGEVIIRTLEEKEQVVILVEDTGIGISAEHVPYIFDSFYRVDQSRNTEKGGAGLGLAIAKRIIVQHHGQIEVESTLEKGSIFRISLPVVE